MPCWCVASYRSRSLVGYRLQPKSPVAGAVKSPADRKRLARKGVALRATEHDARSSLSALLLAAIALLSLLSPFAIAEKGAVGVGGLRALIINDGEVSGPSIDVSDRL